MGVPTRRMVRKLIGPFVLALCLTASSAHASLFTLASYTVDLHTADPGLVLFEDNLLGTPTSFSLNSVGQENTVTLFRIGTNEGALNADDLVPYSIEVGFAFSTPAPGFGGTAEGITGAGWFFSNFGYVVFDNPLVLSFGNTGLLGITLENETFGLPGSAKVDATFKLLRADSGLPASVPEPSSAALVGLGALAVASFRRRSRR